MTDQTPSRRRYFVRDTRTMKVAQYEPTRVMWMTEAEAIEYAADLNALDALVEDKESSSRWTVEEAVR
jgi:hypothetical protein